MALHFTNRYAHCPSCGAALHPRVVKAGEPPRLVCTACEFIYYQNPKIATGVIVGDGARVLLLKRTIEPAYGKWVFPGGYVDLGEVVAEAARREAREEACVEVAIDALLNVYSYPERPVVLVVYTGRITAGTAAAGDECSEARFFAHDEIPWGELAFPSTRDALTDYLRRGAENG